MVKGVPIKPKRKSLRAKCFTTRLMYSNFPTSIFKFDTYNTNPFPRMLINPATKHKITEHQNAIQEVSFSSDIFEIVLQLF